MLAANQPIAWRWLGAFRRLDYVLLLHCVNRVKSKHPPPLKLSQHASKLLKAPPIGLYFLPFHSKTSALEPRIGEDTNCVSPRINMNADWCYKLGFGIKYWGFHTHHHQHRNKSSVSLLESCILLLHVTEWTKVGSSFSLFCARVENQFQKQVSFWPQLIA